MNVPDVNELDSDSDHKSEEEKKGEESANEEGDTAGTKRTHGGTGTSGNGGGDGNAAKKKKVQPWFDRDSVISGALRNHQTWLRNTKRDLDVQVRKVTEIMNNIAPEIQDNVKNEKK